MYVPTYKAIEHSPIIEGHFIERLFDYSSEYFYFEGSDDVHATVASPFYEYVQLIWILDLFSVTYSYF